MAYRLNISFPGLAATVRLPEAPRLWPAGGGGAVCANPRCAERWRGWMKDGRRPVFEGQWGCSRRCLVALVEAAIRREATGSHSETGSGDHAHRIPLGLILLELGWITQPQLEHALNAQRNAGWGRIGRWLSDECGLAPECIVRALARQWGCPVVGTEGFDARAMALVLPEPLLEAFGVLPLRIAGGRILYSAFRDHPDACLVLALEQMSGLKVVSGLTAPGRWDGARQRMYEGDFVDCAVRRVGPQDDLSRRIVGDLTAMQPRASRLVRAHRFYWLRMWLEGGTGRLAGVPRTTEDVADRIYRMEDDA